MEYYQLSSPISSVRSKADKTIPEQMAHQYSLPIRGSSSKPKGYISGNTVQCPPQQIKEPPPDQTLPSNMSQLLLAQPIKDLTHDQKAWDTIIVCSLLSKPFGRPMSPADIANALNVRNQRTTKTPIGPESVNHMLEIALWPSTRKLYPETCGYETWEGVRDRPAARHGVRDDGDEEMVEAYRLFSEHVEDSCT